MKAIVLAAGAGHRMRPAFEDPKCLMTVGGRTLLERTMKAIHRAGVDEAVLVAGYRRDRVARALKALRPEVPSRLIVNSEYRRGSVLSLHAAAEALAGEVLIMDGDLWFEGPFLERAVRSPRRDAFLLDGGAENDGEAVMVGFRRGRAVAMGRGLGGDYDLVGEWAGVLRLSSFGAERLRDAVQAEVDAGRIEQGYEFVVPRLFDRLEIGCERVDDLRWVEIDFPSDWDRAQRLHGEGRETAER